jgi:DNA-binding transcriptional ArsR family regulator
VFEVFLMSLFRDDLLSADNLRKLRVQDPPVSWSPSGENRLPLKVSNPRKHRRFIGGRIYLDWLKPALKRQGKGPLALALAIHFKSRCEPDASSIRVSNRLAEQFGVSKDAKRAALKALEEDGMIEVVRQDGKSPTVRMIEAEP